MTFKKRSAILLSIAMLMTAVFPVYAETAEDEIIAVEEATGISLPAVESVDEVMPAMESADEAVQNRKSVESAEMEAEKQLPEAGIDAEERLLGKTAEPVVSFDYDKESYVYPDPVTITVKLDGVAAAPEAVTWYQMDDSGEYNVIEGKNPIVLPMTVPSSNKRWFVEIRSGEDIYEGDTIIKIFEPEGMVIVFDNQPVYPGNTVTAASTGASGSVSLSQDGLTATVSNVSISNCDSKVMDIFAKLMIFGARKNDYQLIFEGNSDFGYEESPTELAIHSSMLVGFYSGSTMEMRSKTPGEKIDLKGASFVFSETGDPYKTQEEVTKLIMKDINLTAYAAEEAPLDIYVTKLECYNCGFNIKAFQHQAAFEIGIRNFDHPESEEHVWFTNCTIDSETDFNEPGDPATAGAPESSAFSCSNLHVLFKDCTTNLKLDHTPQGECRGIRLLSGELTVDGGSLNVNLDCPLEDFDDPEATDCEELAAAIQAVSFSAKNGAQVKASVKNAPRASWGIIYARDIIIDNSSLDIDVLHSYENIPEYIDEYGFSTQGIYYFGDSRAEASNHRNVWGETRTDMPDDLTYVGNVVISSGSNVDIYLEGTPYSYFTGGISGRYVSVDDSSVSIDVQTHDHAGSELYPGIGTAFVIYNFAEDADIELKNTAIILPSEARIQAVKKTDVLKDEFYTVLDENTKEIAKSVKIHAGDFPEYKHTRVTTAGSGSGTIIPNGSVYTDCNVFIDFTATPDAHSRILHWVVDGVETANGQNSFRLAVGTENHTVQVVFEHVSEPHHASGTTTLFIGSAGNPVTDGTWKINEDGTWSFTTSRTFTNTWGFIRYMANGVPTDSWFWFDSNGKMLTGWQQISWNGKLSWFYFNEIHDGTFGACQLGGITPDGYTLNPDGSWAGF